MYSDSQIYSQIQSSLHPANQPLPNAVHALGANSPNFSNLSQMLQGMPQFQGITAPTINAPGSIYQAASPYQQNAYQAKDMSKAVLPQYDAMRERLNTQYSQLQGQSQDALDRQFAASGGGPGNGAQAKQTENLATGIAKQKGDDLLGINAQEGQARTALQQQEEQRAFESGESQKGYSFQAGQADIGRQFAANELQSQQGFQASQFNAQTGLQAGMFNQQMQQSQNQFNFNANSTIAQLQMAFSQQNIDKWNSAFNAALEAKKNGDGSSVDYLMNQFLTQGQQAGYY